MPEAHFQVVAHYHTSREHKAAVIALLAELAEASRAEEANISYNFFQDLQDPEHLVILERYKNAAGFDLHIQSEHVQRIVFGKIVPLLQNRNVEKFEVHPSP